MCIPANRSVCAYICTHTCVCIYIYIYGCVQMYVIRVCEHSYDIRCTMLAFYIVPMLAQHKTNVGPTSAGSTLDYNLPTLAQCRANEQNDVGPTYVANVGPM